MQCDFVFESEVSTLIDQRGSDRTRTHLIDPFKQCIPECRPIYDNNACPSDSFGARSTGRSCPVGTLSLYKKLADNLIFICLAQLDSLLYMIET